MNLEFELDSFLSDCVGPLPGMGHDRKTPRISLVTPSYNQGQFLQQTILSVMNQRYPNLEYMILDGGSTDGSVDIIRCYEDQLAYWRSQPDGGQAAAIKDGFSRSTGEILGWLNSDDLLLPGALAAVARFFSQHPNVQCLVGGTVVVDAGLNVVRDRLGLPRIVLGEPESLCSLLARRGCSFYQPASFWRREAYERVGGIDPSYSFAMDYDFYVRLAALGSFGHISKLIAAFRVHAESKTTRLQAVRRSECRRVVAQYQDPGHHVRTLLALRNAVRNLPLRIGISLGLVRMADLTGLSRSGYVDW